MKKSLTIQIVAIATASFSSSTKKKCCTDPISISYDSEAENKAERSF